MGLESSKLQYSQKAQHIIPSGEIFFPTKEALSKEAKGESPNYTQQSQKTLQQRRKSNGQKTTKKEINK